MAIPISIIFNLAKNLLPAINKPHEQRAKNDRAIAQAQERALPPSTINQIRENNNRSAENLRNAVARQTEIRNSARQNLILSQPNTTTSSPQHANSLDSILTRLDSIERRNNDNLTRMNQQIYTSQIQSSEQLVQQAEMQKQISENNYRQAQYQQEEIKHKKSVGDGMFNKTKELLHKPTELRKHIEDRVLTVVRYASFFISFLKKYGKRIFNYVTTDLVDKVIPGIIKKLGDKFEIINTFGDLFKKIFNLKDGIIGQHIGNIMEIFRKFSISLGINGTLNPSDSTETKEMKKSFIEDNRELTKSKSDLEKLEKSIELTSQNVIKEIYDNDRGTKDALTNIIEQLKHGGTINANQQKIYNKFLEDIKTKYNVGGSKKGDELVTNLTKTIEDFSNKRQEIDTKEDEKIQKLDSVLNSIVKDLFRHPEDFSVENELKSRKEIADSLYYPNYTKEDIYKKIFVNGLESFYNDRGEGLLNSISSGKDVKLDDVYSYLQGDYRPFFATLLYNRIDDNENHYKHNKSAEEVYKKIKSFRKLLSSRMPYGLGDKSYRLEDSFWSNLFDGTLGKSYLSDLRKNLETFFKRAGINAIYSKDNEKYQNFDKLNYVIYDRKTNNVLKEIPIASINNAVKSTFEKSGISNLTPTRSFIISNHLGVDLDDKDKEFVNTNFTDNASLNVETDKIDESKILQIDTNKDLSNRKAQDAFIKANQAIESKLQQESEKGFLSQTLNKPKGMKISETTGYKVDEGFSVESYRNSSLTKDEQNLMNSSFGKGTTASIVNQPTYLYYTNQMVQPNTNNNNTDKNITNSEKELGG